MKPSPPGLAGGAALGAGKEVLERHVQEGAARFGEHLAVEAEPAVDVDSPAAALRHPGGEVELAVDQHRPAVAHEDPGRHRRKAVPGGEEAAGLVQCGTDESTVDDSGPSLVALAERERRLVALDPLRGGSGKMDPVRVFLPATPARGVMVRRDLYLRPPRSKWAL